MRYVEARPSTSSTVSLAGLGIAFLAIASAPACATGITDDTPDAGVKRVATVDSGSGNAGNGDPGDDNGQLDSGDGTGTNGGDDDASFPFDGSQGDDQSDAGEFTGDSGSNADSGSAETCAAAMSAAFYDFESGTEGWLHDISDGASSGPTWPFDPWTHGTATAGPACPSGSCFGAELTENYAQCQRGYVISPKINLSACAGTSIKLKFDHLYSFWTGSYGGSTWWDGGVVEISADDGANWNTVGSSSDYPGTVTINPNRGSSYACYNSDSFGVDRKPGYVGSLNTVATASLTVPSALVTSQMLIRFSFGSGVSSSTTDADSSRSSTSTGWRIDNVGFSAD